MVVSELPEGWSSVPWKKIFKKRETQQIIKLLEKNDMQGLRDFLKTKNDVLKKNGILPDYMYYYIQYLGSNRLKSLADVI